MARLRGDMSHIGSAVEEILRFLPPVQGTNMNYAREDLEIAGVEIKKGEVAIPLLGSSNRDADVFPDPDVFNITRDPNRHLSFSQGNHFCLGAFLARMEAKTALSVLLERCPDLRLAVSEDELQLATVPLWHRYNELGDYETSYQENYYRDEYTPDIVEIVTSQSSHSCFVASTPVWTRMGPVPIEEIRAGDLVLSQSPATGRLEYRPVLETTTSRPMAVRKLVLEDETITTTLGHRFWVSGEGWRMAKFLKPGECLFGMHGSLELRAKEVAEKAAVYNLVVSDYHTYFVGASRLLVHDINCPQPIAMALPGVVKDSWQTLVR